MGLAAKVPQLAVSRENAQAKGRRMLTEGRLRVLRVERSGLIVAECRGDSGEVYDLGFDPGPREWRCTCLEMKGRCSHLIALMLVTTAPVAESAVA